MHNFKEYIDQAKLTAIYPKETADLYLLNGIVSELGEVAGVLKKYIRDGFSTEELKQKLKAEVGDCFWYLALICDDLYPLFPPEKFYIPCNFMVVKEQFSLNDLSLGLRTIFQALEATSKLYKGRQEEHISDTYRTLIELFVILKNLCNLFNIQVGDILDLNIAKLKSRQERQKLNGDGDYR